jgi:hypothetical protein
MKILSAMLADAADALNGKLYIHGGGWDSLVVREFPAVHPMMAVALLLCADAGESPGTGELRVHLVDEDGNDTGAGAAALLGIGHGPLHRRGQKTLVPISIPFATIRFEKPGGYEFRVLWNGQPLSPSVVFSVVTPPMPSLGQPYPGPPQPESA